MKYASIKANIFLSCQVSNVTLVKISWMCFYSPVEARMVKPLFVLVQFAFEPFRKLPKVIDELPVEVLLKRRAERLINLLHTQSIFCRPIV
jgi:hypothetical protein